VKFASLTISVFVGLFVLMTGQVYSLPSDTVVIAQLASGGSGSGTASQEYILLYNFSADDINVTNWCLNYSSSANDPNAVGATKKELACVVPPDDQTELWVTSGGYISFTTDEFDLANVGFVSDFGFSTGVAGPGGHVWLTDAQGLVIDLIGWGSAVAPEGIAADEHMSGEVLSRDLTVDIVDTDVNLADFSSQPILSPVLSGLYEKAVVVDVCPNIEGIQLEFPSGFLADVNGDCIPDFCPNIDGLQVESPAGYEKLEGEEDCTLIPLEDAVLLITELLPNAPSFDKGLEFIEIFNTNSVPVDLVGYTLQLGLSFSKEFSFVGGVIQPGEYLTFSDLDTGIVLPNTASTSVRLVAPAGNVVSETGVYSNANDNVSWAIVSDIWIYTNQITPGSANKPFLEPAVNEVLGITSVLAPCPAGKFRNPATNRCKNIVSAVSQLTPCAADQSRNPATNRCKKISSSTSSLVPCKEGQERNPTTNRCRNVATLGGSSELSSVTDVAVESSEGQLNWPIILLSIGGTLAYMAYEWRFELRSRLLSYRTQ